jgi:hypothetical protein
MSAAFERVRALCEVSVHLTAQRLGLGFQLEEQRNPLIAREQIRDMLTALGAPGRYRRMHASRRWAGSRIKGLVTGAAPIVSHRVV